jgi:hypothetical protein
LKDSSIFYEPLAANFDHILKKVKENMKFSENGNRIQRVLLDDLVAKKNYKPRVMIIFSRNPSRILLSRV